MQLQEPSDCANCGAVLAGDARFCQRCGAPVSRSAVDDGVELDDELDEDAPRSALGWVIRAGAALLVLLAVAAVGFALLVLVFEAFVE